MKITNYGSALLLALIIAGCGGKEDKKSEGFSIERSKTEEPKTEVVATGVPASQRVELLNKGVGPVKELTLETTIDTALAEEGKAVYDQLCLACHRVGKKFIGPAPNGILERRSPEWVMNMILNPEVMVVEDPLAKELFIEYNGSPMANQGLTIEQARAILEYFRTLE